MTASAKTNKPNTPTTGWGVFELITQAVKQVNKNAESLFGLTAWILIPALGYFLVPHLPTPLAQDIVTTLCDTGVLCASLLAIYAIIATLADIKPIELSKDIKQRFISFVCLSMGIAAIQILGFFALIIPGLIAVSLFSIARPIFIIERSSIVTTLKKSIAQTKNLIPGILWRVIVGNSLAAIVMLSALQPILLLNAEPHILAIALAVVQALILPYLVSYEYTLYVSLKKR